MRRRDVVVPLMTAAVLAVVLLAQTIAPRSRDIVQPAGRFGADVWTIQTGAGGWGNRERQDYTRDAVTLKPDGAIRLTATLGSKTTSGRITTAGKWSFTTGTLTARIRLPEGKGLLPAFWLLGDDLDTAGWPACGEIDVVEAPSSTATSVHSIHGPLKLDPLQEWKLNLSTVHQQPLAEGFHDYTVERVPDRVVIRLDDQVVLDRSRSQLEPAQRWVFDQPFHVLFSLAVGGNWPGSPDQSTPRSSSMEISWVRYDPQTTLASGGS